jgi:hypothetical protein
MLIHAPGASTALDDTPFNAVKITGWAATLCSVAQAAKKRKTTDARVNLIVQPSVQAIICLATLAGLVVGTLATRHSPAKSLLHAY